MPVNFLFFTITLPRTLKVRSFVWKSFCSRFKSDFFLYALSLFLSPYLLFPLARSAVAVSFLTLARSGNVGKVEALAYCGASKIVFVPVKTFLR